MAGEGRGRFADPAWCRAGARDVSTYGFSSMLAPARIAVVGVGDHAGSVGGAVVANLRAGGFSGAIDLVNPNRTEVQGEPCHASVSDLPQVPDLVVVATPPEVVPEIVEAAGQRGAAAVCIISAQLGRHEHEPFGAARRSARRHGVRLIGPGSVGIALPSKNLNATLFSHPPLAGDLALITQSGNVASAIAAWATRRGIGFSTILTLGRSADVDIADGLDHAAADPATRAILLSLHRVGDARKFLSAARAAARVKPVVVLRTGRYEPPREPSQTQTGALARPGAVYDAAFRRAGLLSVDDLDGLFSAAETLRRVRPFPGQRIAILANGRGIGSLAADRLADLGGVLAELGAPTREVLAPLQRGGVDNPFDLGADAEPAAFAAALGPMLADRAIDAVLTLHVPTVRAEPSAVAEGIAAAVAGQGRSGGRRKPVFSVCIGEGGASAATYAKAGIPLFATETDAIAGFRDLVRYREAQDDLMRTPPSLPRDFAPDLEAARIVVADALAEGRSWLDPIGVARLLGAYHIETVPFTLAPDPEGAADAAWPLIAAGNSVALKLVSPDIVHKSDVGGVRLGLTSEAAVKAAARAMIAQVRGARPDARIAGFTVQPMIRRPHGRELIAGLAEDATFGPVVVFGRGGTAVEIIDDRSLALPPLDLRLAQEQIGRTRVARILAAYRDVPAADLDGVALVLVKVAQLAADLPEVRELDINPLLADAEGVVALDARVRIAPQGPGRRTASNARFAIRPYPSEWERLLTLKGRRIAVRPVRPEDEGLFASFFAKLDPEDVRLRFFAPMRTFSHSFLARLIQLDYARSIAFVALDEDGDGDRMLGAVRLHADANLESGEFGILVRSDQKGYGLGFALMRLMIDWAVAEGLTRIEGMVLAENKAMLAVCRRIGFTQKVDPDDPGVVTVELRP